MELLVLVIGLMVLGLLAARFGYDSRDGFGTAAQGTDAYRSGRTALAYEQELARETQNARRHRLGVSREVTVRPQAETDDFAQAA
jgi:hypothetical protein